MTHGHRLARVSGYMFRKGLSVGAVTPERIARDDGDSYHRLRLAISILAVLFPIVVVASGLPSGRLHLVQNSLSAYYYYANTLCGDTRAGDYLPLHPAARDVFVGGLCAIGVFLIAYRGYSWQEDWALNLAGVLAATIALSPMDAPAHGCHPLVPVAALPAIGPGSWHALIHYTSAVLFFLAIGYVAVARSHYTLQAMATINPARAEAFGRRYTVIGWAMILGPSAIILAHMGMARWHVLGVVSVMAPWLAGWEARWTLLVEAVGVWIFATYWLIKAYEILTLTVPPSPER